LPLHWWHYKKEAQDTNAVKKPEVTHSLPRPAWRTGLSETLGAVCSLKKWKKDLEFEGKF
jgi:hypothetical protein